MALAGKLKYNICVLNLAERGLTDDRLAVALSAVPPQVSNTISFFVPKSVEFPVLCCICIDTVYCPVGRCRCGIS
jgi:hypothetical protein